MDPTEELLARYRSQDVLNRSVAPKIGRLPRELITAYERGEDRLSLLIEARYLRTIASMEHYGGWEQVGEALDVSADWAFEDDQPDEWTYCHYFIPDELRDRLFRCPRTDTPIEIPARFRPSLDLREVCERFVTVDLSPTHDDDQWILHTMLMVLDDAFVLICAYAFEHEYQRRRYVTLCEIPRTGDLVESLLAYCRPLVAIVATLRRELDLAGTDVEVVGHAARLLGVRDEPFTSTEEHLELSRTGDVPMMTLGLVQRARACWERLRNSLYPGSEQERWPASVPLTRVRTIGYNTCNPDEAYMGKVEYEEEYTAYYMAAVVEFLDRREVVSYAWYDAEVFHDYHFRGWWPSPSNELTAEGGGTLAKLFREMYGQVFLAQRQRNVDVRLPHVKRRVLVARRRSVRAWYELRDVLGRALASNDLLAVPAASLCAETVGALVDAGFDAVGGALHLADRGPAFALYNKCIAAPPPPLRPGHAVEAQISAEPVTLPAPINRKTRRLLEFVYEAAPAPLFRIIMSFL